MVLGACTTPPTADAPTPRTEVPASKPAVAKLPAQQPVKPAPPATPQVVLTPQEAQKAISAAIDYLETGQEELADAELQKVAQSDPGNRLAQSLLKQIHEDPVTLYGASSFAYRVPAGESLSRVAQRFMSDALQFYGLARYNNIKVPRALGEGQMLRVPGRAPAASAAMAPSPAPRELSSSVPPVSVAPMSAAPPPMPAAAPTPSPQPAPTPVAVAAPTPEPPPPAVESGSTRSARMVKEKAEAVTRHTRSARAAFAKQDLQGALLGWDAVLAVEPDNRTALLERQKVLSLMEKFGKMK